MKMPFRRTNDDDIDGDEEFYERLMRLQGIPVPADPPPMTPPGIPEESMKALIDAIDRVTIGPRIRPTEPQKATVADVATKKPEWVGHTVVSQSEHACCELNARDGLIFYALNGKGAAVVAEHLPHETHVALVRILAVDEHTGLVLSLNTDAEAMKRLMNALPGLIKAAEVARDEAVAILAGER